MKDGLWLPVSRSHGIERPRKGLGAESKKGPKMQEREKLTSTAHLDMVTILTGRAATVAVITTWLVGHCRGPREG